jgi:hypothetical protein
MARSKLTEIACPEFIFAPHKECLIPSISKDARLAPGVKTTLIGIRLVRSLEVWACYLHLGAKVVEMFIS